MSIFGRQFFGVTRRSLSRLMAGLFAVQVLAAGFCLLSNEAHAMPAMQHQDMGEHCARSMPDGDAGGHSDACFHCDDADMFVKAGGVDVPAYSPVLVLVIASLPAEPLPSASKPVSGMQMPTGPPRSSTLLYSTTQRIRV